MTRPSFSPALELRHFMAAVQFLTRLPVPDPGLGAAGLASAARWFAAVGVLVGGLAGLALLGLSTALPQAVAAGCALGLLIWLTGALHEDGLADLADGLGGHADKARALEIMRDSRLGSYGVLALVFSVGLRWAALASLAPAEGALALLIACTAGRAFMVPATAVLPYVRREGLGSSVAGGASPIDCALALGTAAAVATLAGLAGLIALVLAAGAAALLLLLQKRRLGGYTGDGLGAAAQAGEITALCILAGMLG